MARAGCEQVMLTFGYPWPENLECTQFPPNHELCVNGDIPPGSPIDLSPPGSSGLNPILTDPTHNWNVGSQSFDTKYAGPGKSTG